jgi:prepilin-type N-terminal cleavage/methylation domain-containing protein
MKNIKSDMNFEGKIMKKSAFTMIELVLVIVVLGIFAALTIPRIDRDIRQEAQANIVSALRYTQNLALIDNKTDPRTNSYAAGDWQKTLWQMRFRDVNSQWYYTISSDLNREGGIDKVETAIDITNGKRMYNGTGDYTIDSDESPNIFLTKKYGINNITLSCDTDGAKQLIAFDHLGRPHANISSSTTNDYSTYLQNDCIITVQFIDTDISNLIITVEAETGYISAI